MAAVVVVVVMVVVVLLRLRWPWQPWRRAALLVSVVGVRRCSQERRVARQLQVAEKEEWELELLLALVLVLPVLVQLSTLPYP